LAFAGCYYTPHRRHQVFAWQFLDKRPDCGLLGPVRHTRRVSGVVILIHGQCLGNISDATDSQILGLSL
jgi:hypothetical protein